MSEHANSTPNEPKLYYLPGDPSKTPLSHDDYVAIMRDFWKQRKQLQRAGECNAPANHPCCCDCCDCPYRTQQFYVSLNDLEDAGYEPEDPSDVAETVIHKMLLEQVKDTLPMLDEIDRIIIEAKFLRHPTLSDRECETLIFKLTGQSISHQAVGKRLPKALERLSQLVNGRNTD